MKRVIVLAEEKTNAQRVSITLPPEVIRQIDAECDALGIARSTYILLAVQSKLRSDVMMRDMPGMMVKAAEMMKFLQEMDSRGCLPGQIGIGENKA